MKKIISPLLSISISLLFILMLFFSILILIKSNSFVTKTLYYTDYFGEASNSITNNLSNIIKNDDLKSVIPNIVTKERIERDITNLFNFNNNISESIKNDFYSGFTIELKDTNYEDESLMNLVSRVGNAYVKSLFPYNNYTNLITRINNSFNVKLLLILSIVSLIILISVSIISKNFITTIIRSNYITIFILIFISIFCKFNFMFESFYYINTHFSNYLILMYNMLIDLIIIISIILFIVNLFLVFYKYKNDCN